MSRRFNLTLSILGVFVCGVLFVGVSATPSLAQTKAVTSDAPVISIAKDGEIYLSEQPVNINRLTEEINRVFPKASAVYVRADKLTSWGAVSQVIAALDSMKLPIKFVSK